MYIYIYKYLHLHIDMWLHVDISIYIDDSNFIYFNMYYTVLDRWLVGVELFDKHGSRNFQGCTDTCIQDGALTVCCPSVYCKNEAWQKKLQAKGGVGIWGNFARNFVDQGWRFFFVDKNDPPTVERPPSFVSHKIPTAQMAVGAMG